MDECCKNYDFYINDMQLNVRCSGWFLVNGCEMDVLDCGL
jgi:hypothetical protein